MSSARVTYSPRADTSLEPEISALAAVYRFVLFESEASKKTAERAPTVDARREGGGSMGNQEGVGMT